MIKNILRNLYFRVILMLKYLLQQIIERTDNSFVIPVVTQSSYSSFERFARIIVRTGIFIVQCSLQAKLQGAET